MGHLISSDGRVLFTHATAPVGERTVFITHSHPLIECAFYVRGNIHFRWGISEIRPRPGSVLVIPQGILHALEAEADVPYERYTLHYYPDALPDTLQDFLSNSLMSTVQYIEDFSELLPDLSALAACFSLPEHIRDEAIRARLYSLLIHINTRCNQQEKMQSQSDVIPPMLEFIHMNIQNAQDVTIDALAQRFFISKSQLRKLFLRSKGISPAKYIRMKRYEYAELLRGRGMPMVEAASKAGFRCYSTYYRIKEATAEGPETEEMNIEEVGQVAPIKAH